MRNGAVCSFESVFARIHSQCVRLERLDNAVSLFFQAEISGRMIPFSIPRPLVNGDGYTLDQLKIIEAVLDRVEVELWPLASHAA